MSAMTQTFGSILRLTRAIVQGDNKVEIEAGVKRYHRQDGYRSIGLMSSSLPRLKEIKARLADDLPRICKKNARVHVSIPNGSMNGKPYISISIWRAGVRKLTVE